jgi:GntR family transcriptional regulator
VLKGYQELVDELLVEKKRGRGMYVAAGARAALLKGERQKFLDSEWPRVAATIQRLGFRPEELLAALPPVPAPVSPASPVVVPAPEAGPNDTES